MADTTKRGAGSKNLPPEVKEKWKQIGKHHQNQFNAIQKEQGIDAGIDYINSTYADKYSSGANAPDDTIHHVVNSDNEPPVTMHYVEDSDTAPETEGKKKITALLPDSLHRRLSLHAAVTGSSINQIIATLIQNHVPDYQISVKG